MLDMSHGNLEYHFKNKEALLMAIYRQMKKDISGMYVDQGKQMDPFFHFNELLKRLETFHEIYSFFNLDVLVISRNYPEVSALLKTTFQIRKEQMTHFYERFNEMGYFKKEPLPGMYIRLRHTVRIFITFWNSQKEVLPYFKSAQDDSMSVYIWDLLIPNMTEKGLEVYRNLITNETAVK
jgi:AcrR family transcriptional regulator